MNYVFVLKQLYLNWGPGTISIQRNGPDFYEEGGGVYLIKIATRAQEAVCFHVFLATPTKTQFRSILMKSIGKTSGTSIFGGIALSKLQMCTKEFVAYPVLDSSINLEIGESTESRFLVPLVPQYQYLTVR